MVQSVSGNGDARPGQRLLLVCDSHLQDVAHRHALVRQLAPLIDQGLIEYFDHDSILAGHDQLTDFTKQVDTADIILVLTGPETLADNHEVHRRAVARHLAGQAAVFRVPIRACMWEQSVLAGLPALPAQGPPIAARQQPETAWKLVASRVMQLLWRRGLLAEGAMPPHWMEALLRIFVVRHRRYLLPGLLLLLLLATLLVGIAVQAARARLLGIDSSSFHYSWTELLSTGVAVPRTLIWRALYGIWLGAGPERSMLLPLLAWIVAAWALRRRWPRVALAFLTATLPGVVYGFGVLMQPLGLRDVALRECPAGITDFARAAHEACSWLINASGLTDINEMRRHALCGLFVWSMAALAAAVLFALRGPAWRPLRTVLTVGYGMMLLTLLGLLPQAYLFGSWGLSYPRVLAMDGDCDARLSQSLREGDCTAWDVSAGAQEAVLIIEGRCPGPVYKLTAPAGRCSVIGSLPEPVRRSR